MINMPDNIHNALQKVTKNAVALYPYGSRVYGTAGVNSDWDYIAVMGKARKKGDMRNGLINIKYMTPDHFQYLLDEHHITALECYFLRKDRQPSPMISPSEPWKFKLDKAKLYKSLSEKTDRDWTKAKNKLVSPYDEKDIIKAKKAIYHSMRIMEFGLQIASCGRIDFYNEMGSVHHDLMQDTSRDWIHYHEKWDHQYASLRNSFQKATEQ